MFLATRFAMEGSGRMNRGETFSPCHSAVNHKQLCASMGTAATLSVGKFEVFVTWNENHVSHGCLFQDDDLKSFAPYESDEPPVERYERPLGTLIGRLELLGYTIETARAEYTASTLDDIFDPLDITFDEVLEILRTVDLSLLADPPTQIKPEEIEGNPPVGLFVPIHLQDKILAVRTGWNPFFGRHWDLDALLEKFGPYTTLRLLAESPHNAELPVVWDFFGVVSTGWIRRHEISHGLEQREQYLIVTEGSSDAYILRKSLDLLRPDVADYFYFVDMKDNYPFSGTGSLANFVKGLIKIGVQNKICVVFDNDTEGVSTMNLCIELPVPKNMRILRLPDLPEFDSFPTIGPGGRQLVNINGLAAAIECYLDLGSDPCVRWTVYKEKMDAYQGALINKEQYSKRFYEQRGKTSLYDYSKLNLVLDSIMAACVSMNTPSLPTVRSAIEV
ncbi:hypothetical protein J2W34_006336 [Variovorax boronicumulans]|uniref:HEPN/Toprim-associated domain-containing protein n=1 Tax=Variovorax boronicumulans TaxID=436515 RepID=UPI00277F7ACC|nr:HEPN/Toprim-associated domain-containing protein [Variovorax boronicumulans]MDQ0074512.1 hypothetical protein [Variovorax boronicumulans]